MLLTRRKIITGAAASLLYTPKASAWKHGSSLVPPPAAAHGFTSRTFFDDFTSLSTIDVNDTGAPGFNWYTHGQWPLQPGFVANSPTPPSAYSVSNSILSLHDGQSFGAGFSTLYQDGTGQAFGNGAYFEGLMSNTRTNVGNPAFWCWSKENLLGQSLVTAEMDFIEYFNTGTFPSGPGTTIHDWTYNSGSNSYVGPSTSTQTMMASGDTAFHKIGFLWVPTAKNAGTGIFETYVDNVLVPNSNYTYTASAGGTSGVPAGSKTDSESFVILLGAASGNPLLVDYIAVWQ